MKSVFPILYTLSVPGQILPRPVPRCALLVLSVSSTPCQGAVFKPAQSYVTWACETSSYRADRWLIRCRVCSRRALGKLSLNCYPDTRSLHNAGRRAGQVNRNRCSNVSFTEAILVSDSETKNSFGAGDIRTAISIHMTSSPAHMVLQTWSQSVLFLGSRSAVILPKNHRSDMARAGCVVFLGLALLLNQLHAVTPCVDHGCRSMKRWRCRARE